MWHTCLTFASDNECPKTDVEVNGASGKAICVLRRVNPEGNLRPGPAVFAFLGLLSFKRSRSANRGSLGESTAYSRFNYTSGEMRS